MKKITVIVLTIITIITCSILYNRINSNQQVNNQQIEQITTCGSGDSAIIILHYNCNGKENGVVVWENKKCKK